MIIMHVSESLSIVPFVERSIISEVPLYTSMSYNKLAAANTRHDSYRASTYKQANLKLNLLNLLMGQS